MRLFSGAHLRKYKSVQNICPLLWVFAKFYSHWLQSTVNQEIHEAPQWGHQSKWDFDSRIYVLLGQSSRGNKFQNFTWGGKLQVRLEKWPKCPYKCNITYLKKFKWYCKKKKKPLPFYLPVKCEHMPQLLNLWCVRSFKYVK